MKTLTSISQTSSSPISSIGTLPLKDYYQNKFLIGTALSIAALRGRDPLSVVIAQRDFNAFTAENSMKPAIIQPKKGEFHFAEADQLVELAEECDAYVVGHTLVWHEQTPRWFFQTPEGQLLPREEALQNLRDHIAVVVGRYKGRIREWDVVNEAVSDVEGEEMRPSEWYQAAGEEFIAEAFYAAHAADPDAILIYNDYNIEVGAKREKTLRLLERLLAANVPVHAVGIQGHWHLEHPDLDEIELAIQQFSALGLRVMITELDIGVLPTKYQGADIKVREALKPEMNPYIDGLPEAVAQRQAARYEEIFALFLRYENVIDRVTFWGVHDGISWLNDFPILGRTDYSLPFDRQGQPKPAFYALGRAGEHLFDTLGNLDLANQLKSVGA